MPKQGKTPKKKSKEKTPQKSGCSILKKLGVEDSRIEEATRKDMVARKIECELNADRAINPPRDTSRYQKEVGTFIWRLEAFAKNFAELRQFGQCSDIVLNRVGSKDIVNEAYHLSHGYCQ